MESFFENPGLWHIGENILNNLDLQSQLKCCFVRKSWKLKIENLQIDFSEKHLTELSKVQNAKGLIRWKRLVGKIGCEASFLTKFYLLDLFQKHEGKSLEAPLTTFLRVNNFKMVELILQNSLFRGDDWSFELRIAVKTGKTEVVKCLVQHYPKPLQRWDIQKPLFLATQNGDFEVMKILLEIADPSFA